MTFTRTSAHTVARLHAAVAMAALNTFRSPHAAQEVGLASAGRTLQNTAKKGFTGTREYGAAKKAANGELAAAKTSGKKLVVVNDKAKAKNFREAKKAGIIDGKTTLRDTSGEHGVSKKLNGEGKAMAKKDGSLRVGHHVTVQRGRVNGSSVRRATANGGWTRHAA